MEYVKFRHLFTYEVLVSRLIIFYNKGIFCAMRINGGGQDAKRSKTETGTGNASRGGAGPAAGGRVCFGGG